MSAVGAGEVGAGVTGVMVIDVDVFGDGNDVAYIENEVVLSPSMITSGSPI